MCVHMFVFQTREELQQTREDLQKTKEKLVNEGETYRKKILDLESDHSSLLKANAELEVCTVILPVCQSTLYL